MTSDALLEVDNLHVSFSTYGGEVKAVRGVSFRLNRGETLAIVGESGCGKSVTARSIMRLLPKNNSRISEGSIRFNGRELTGLSEKQMRDVRGSDIAIIFQDAMTALNPTMMIGEQLMEGVIRHQHLSRAEAKKRAIEMLQFVGIRDPELRLKQHLHQFSGGMRQRIMIAMAAICSPAVLIADEPTTALDVTIQAQILELFRMLQRTTDASIIMITHDLGVVASIADRVNVMYAGQVVESAPVKDLFRNPQHPYTRALLDSIPRLDRPKGTKLDAIPGTPPDLFDPPKGCAFAARCSHAMEVCGLLPPDTVQLGGEHTVACWLQDARARTKRPLATREMETAAARQS